MKPRDFLNFFKTKSGKLVVFGALFAAGLVIFSVIRKHHTSADDGIAVARSPPTPADKPQVVQSVTRPMQVFSPPPPKSSPQSSTMTNPAFPNPSPQPLPNVPPHQTDSLAPISLFADSTAGAARPKKLSAVYAPFGRLIPCETVITVDSASMQTPIVGLVTENIYYGGKLIIPAGTEVHGMAQTDRQRDRIASSTSWKLVWQDGEEMQLKAVALDREFDNNTNQTGWAITDGSAGLRGELIKSDNLADIKLFAATFLSGAASALTEKQQTDLWPHQQSHAQQRAVCGRAGRAANLRATNFGFDSKERILRPRALAANSFTSTSCKPLTAPTPRLAARAWPKKRTNNPQPHQNHETILSHSPDVPHRVLDRAQARAATATTAASGG